MYSVCKTSVGRLYRLVCLNFFHLRGPFFNYLVLSLLFSFLLKKKESFTFVLLCLSLHDTTWFYADSSNKCYYYKQWQDCLCRTRYLWLIMMQCREIQSSYNNSSLEKWRCRMDTEEYGQGMTRDGAQAGHWRTQSYNQLSHGH